MTLWHGTFFLLLFFFIIPQSLATKLDSLLSITIVQSESIIEVCIKNYSWLVLTCKSVVFCIFVAIYFVFQELTVNFFKTFIRRV